jgi:hypothetical protein
VGRGSTCANQTPTPRAGESGRVPTCAPRMLVMEGSATAQEQRIFAQRLIAAGERLHHRADESERVVIDGEVIVGDNGALCESTETSTVS